MSINVANTELNNQVAQVVVEAELIANNNQTPTSILSMKDAAPIGRRMLLPEEAAELNTLKNMLPAGDNQSILSFAIDVQRPIADETSKMLEGVRNKDAGPAAGLLSELSTSINGVDMKAFDAEDAPWYKKIIGLGHSIKKAVKKYETVEKQFMGIAAKLEENRMQMLEDMAWNDRMYKHFELAYRRLELRIFALEERIQEALTIDIPEAQNKAETSQDMMDAQIVRRLVSWKDDLERKVHNVRLTRQLILQAMGTAQLLYEDDKSLADSIQDGILTALPLLRIQVSQAISMANTATAAKSKSDLRDTMNKIVIANAKNLRETNKAVREEMEKGLVEMSSLELAQRDIIGAIGDAIEIANRGAKDRADAKTKLAEMDKELRAILSGKNTLTEIVTHNTLTRG